MSEPLSRDERMRNPGLTPAYCLALEYSCDFLERALAEEERANDKTQSRCAELERERDYLRQFENPGEVAAVANQINAEQVERAEYAERENARLREELKNAAAGKYPRLDAAAREWARRALASSVLDLAAAGEK